MFRWFNKAPNSKAPAPDMQHDSADTKSVERRLVPRKNIFADALVMSHEGTCVNKAVLLDISESGARLRLTNNAEIEGPLWIKIGRFRLELEALPMWRSRTDVGIAFLF